jgi:murein DD-endopeptidase MepM/ murein hydrolase activator NlpD
MKKFYVLIIAFLTLAPFCAVKSQSLKDLNDSLAELERRREETNGVLELTRRLRETAQSESDLLDADVIETADAIYKAESELEPLRAEREAIMQSLEETRALRDERREIFKKRLAAIYENGETGYLEALLESKDFSSVLKKIEYINSIIEYDNNLVRELAEIEHTISEREAAAARQTLIIETRLADMQTKKNYLEAKLEEKRVLIENLNNDAASLQEELNKLAESDRKIEAMILEVYALNARVYNFGGLGREGQITTGGLLNWPVPGYYNLSSQYQSRINPISGRGEFHSGLDIPAPVGAPIVAAEAGTVIYSGWMNGYGLTVVIDHGEGLCSLYGHNSALSVLEGDEAERGQTVARAGSTGYSTGPHCHFEVRIDGKHVDPNPYLYVF